jgi:hypothetical protein
MGYGSHNDNNDPVLSYDNNGNDLLSHDGNGNSWASYDGNGNNVLSHDGNGNIIGSFDGNGNAIGSFDNNGNTYNVVPPNQSQQQQEQQQQQQQESSTNENSNANCNTNENVNLNSTCVDVKVDVSAVVSPVVGDDNTGSVIYIPQTFNQDIYSTGPGTGDGGTNTEIALDQINNLTANNYAQDLHNSDNSCAYVSADNDGAASIAGGVSQGDLATGLVNANTSTAANADAFTQSIVLGANIQSNSFTLTLTGHDSSVETGGHHS